MLQTAVILAGGFGTRLQRVVNNVPKPMAPVCNQPFLNYQLRFLKHFGLKRVVLSVGHLHQTITGYYGKNFEGLELDYVIENEPLGTGGGIRLALEMCSDHAVLALNGDSFFDFNLKSYYEKFRHTQAEVALALRRVPDAGRYGTIQTNPAGKILSFNEKNGKPLPGLINAGVYILSTAQFLKHTPANKNFSIERDFFETRPGDTTLHGFEFDGYFIDIGVPEDYQKAQHDFERFAY